MTPELTPDERQRIYLEEKARFEAAQTVRQEAKGRRSNRTAVGCLVVFIVVMVVVVLTQLFSSSTAPPRAPSIADGTEVYVSAEGSGCLAGATKEDFESADRSYRMGDKLGTAKMVMNGSALLLDNGTRIMVIGSSGDLYQVRILTGQMIAREAWLPRRSIRAYSR